MFAVCTKNWFASLCFSLRLVILLLMCIQCCCYYYCCYYFFFSSLEFFRYSLALFSQIASYRLNIFFPLFSIHLNIVYVNVAASKHAFFHIAECVYVYVIQFFSFLRRFGLFSCFHHITTFFDKYFVVFFFHSLGA